MPTNSSSGADSRPVDILYDLLKETRARPGDECSICLEPVTSATTLAHKTCSLLACRECLLTWLATNSSCPMCRVQLTRDRPDELSDEEEEEEDLEDIIAARRARRTPTRYRVVSSLGNLRQRIASGLSEDELRYKNIWQSIYEEIDDSKKLFQELGISELTSITARELIGKVKDFGLSSASLRELWLATRIGGARTFYLAQFDMQPELGYWVPLMHRFRSESSLAHVGVAQSTVRERLERGSVISHVPIPTRLLLDLMRHALTLYPWDRQGLLRTFHKRALFRFPRFWSLVDLRDDSLTPGEYTGGGIRAIPFPEDQLEEGFRTRTLPGLAQRDTSAELGFDRVYADGRDFDDRMFTAFIREWRQEGDLSYDQCAISYYGEAPSDDLPARLRDRIPADLLDRFHRADFDDGLSALTASLSRTILFDVVRDIMR